MRRSARRLGRRPRHLGWCPLRLTPDFVAPFIRRRLIGYKRPHRVGRSLLSPLFGLVFLVAGMFPCFRTSTFGHTFGEKPLAQRNRDVFIHRAGMGLLLLHSQLRQEIEYDARLYFQLTRQLVNPNFLHRRNCCFNSLEQLNGLDPVSPLVFCSQCDRRSR